MLRIKLNELAKGNDNGLLQTEVWKWDGIGWNEYVAQQEEDFIRADDELFVTLRRGGAVPGGLLRQAAGASHHIGHRCCRRSAGRSAASGPF